MLIKRKGKGKLSELFILFEYSFKNIFTNILSTFKTFSKLRIIVIIIQFMLLLIWDIFLDDLKNILKQLS